MPAGGLLKLTQNGGSDIYLTGNPQITFFKVVYRRHTNFSIETVKHTFKGCSELSSNSSSIGIVNISKEYDLLSKIYVKYNQTSNNSISGDQLMDYVSIEIGGEQVDKHTKEWLQIWAELTTPESKSAGYKYLTNGFNNKLSSIYTETNQQSIIIPLQFWFCRNIGLALPLCALEKHEVNIICKWNATNINLDTQPICEVWCDYIYLDTDEKTRFTNVSHEYLIDQVQFQEELDASNQYKLNFKHNVRELIWTNNTNDIITQKAKFTVNDTDVFEEQNKEYFQILQPLNYHTSIPGYNIKHTERPQNICPINIPVIRTYNSIVSKHSVILERKQITFHPITYKISPLKIGDVLNISYNNNNYSVQIETIEKNEDKIICRFKLWIPLILFEFPKHNEKISINIVARTQDPQSRCSQLTRDINVYSFALEPEKIQPSGTCNFSAIDPPYLNFSDKLGSKEPLNIYAVNYNVLRIMSGMGGLAYGTYDDYVNEDKNMDIVELE